jgi:hypothetical protein
MLHSQLAFVGCVLEDDMEGARRYATMSVQRTLEYFFGDWRNVPQRILRARGEAELRKTLSYAPEYLDAVMMSGVLQDWPSARRLSEYPNRDLCAPINADTLEENSYVYLLCSFLLGDFRVPDGNEDLAFIRSRRSKRIALLAALAVGVSNRDSTAFNADLREYLKYLPLQENSWVSLGSGRAPKL